MKSFYVNNDMFDYVYEIVPDKVNGRVKRYLPQAAYATSDDLPLHKYGAGPFCHFAIPNIRVEGVYLITSNEAIKYVGECENFSNRFNMGYGNISPRNCFIGGQPTNCRINHNIYEMAKDDCKIVLFFHETDNRFEVERELIGKLNPEWKISKGKYKAPNRLREHPLGKGAESTLSKNANGKGKSSGPITTVRTETWGGKRMTCRDEVVFAVQSIVKGRGVNRFTVSEVVEYMMARKTPYQESTIRTHIVSKCCINSPRHHAVVFNDFERVEHGVYKLHKFEH